MGVLAEHPMQCPAKKAMQFWSFRKDPRPWYVRRQYPGGAVLSMECCDAPHLHTCSERTTSCMKAESYTRPLIGLS